MKLAVDAALCPVSAASWSASTRAYNEPSTRRTSSGVVDPTFSPRSRLALPAAVPEVSLMDFPLVVWTSTNTLPVAMVLATAGLMPFPPSLVATVPSWLAERPNDKLTLRLD